ncbi:MAG TPA: hypothetical protein VK960_09835 [Acidimicrobiia bacterium]|nr:hypothetical protein [Acidimicrobiia bacterium]
MLGKDDREGEIPEGMFWRRWLTVGLAALPLLVWWVSWYPGMLSFASLEQLAAIDAGRFPDPAIHSIFVWLVTRVWSSPASVTLLQVAAMVTLLDVFVRRARALGIPHWLAGGTVVLLAWLPAVGATVNSLEVQVAQTLVGIWILVELMALAPDPAQYLGRPWSQARLGGALGLSWLLDPAGFIVFVFVAVVSIVALRRRAEVLVVPLAGAVGLALLVQGPLYALFSVDRDANPIALAYAPEMAAVHNHDPGWFDESDRALLTAVADLDVWEDAYRCGDGASLIADREFDPDAIARQPGAYRGLLARATATHPLTVLGHRVCAAGIFFIPGQPLGVQFSTYAYNIPPNNLGIERQTLWEQGFNLTKAVLVRVDQPDRLWLFWRPAILVWPALAGIVVLIWRRVRTAWPGMALGAYLLLGFVTVREPSFREAFAVYALALLSLPLWWPAVSGAVDEVVDAPGGGE